MSKVFVIKENNSGCKETCPVCEDIHKPSINFTIFEESSNKPICRECQEEYAPTLRKMLDSIFSPNPNKVTVLRALLNQLEIQGEMDSVELEDAIFELIDCASENVMAILSDVKFSKTTAKEAFEKLVKYL